MTIENKKLIQILSGGMDSVTLLYYLVKHKCEVKTLSINYGQRHSKEIDFAKYHSNLLNIEHQVADLQGINHLLGKESVLINKSINVPDGHYEELVMKKTVVPNRNMLMLAVATSYAISEKFHGIVYGAHAGDHAIYPDCRKEFTDALAKAIQICDWHQVELFRPFINKTKADIASIGKNLNVDFTKTWSCYKGGEKQCGQCATCIERREAFHLSGVEDHTEYKDNAPTIEDLAKVDFKMNA